MSTYAGLLYAQPSFMEGVGRLVDSAGLLDGNNYSSIPDEADMVALMSDWCAVGEDLRSAVLDFAKRHGIEIGNG